MRPAAAINKKKQESIIKTAKFYAIVNQHKMKKFRFDVAEVFLDNEKRIKKINYMESAFSL